MNVMMGILIMENIVKNVFILVRPVTVAKKITVNLAKLWIIEILTPVFVYAALVFMMMVKNARPVCILARVVLV